MISLPHDAMASPNRRWPQLNEWWATPFPSKRYVVDNLGSHLLCCDLAQTLWERTLEGFALNEKDHLISYISGHEDEKNTRP